MHNETNETNEAAAARPFADGRILVVALKGWNDAGEAASSAVATLASSLGINRKVAVIDDEEFFDYSINRPHSIRNSAGERRIVWPHVAVLQPATSDDDLVVVDPEDIGDAHVEADFADDAYDDGPDEYGDRAPGAGEAASDDARRHDASEPEVVLGPGDVPMFSLADDGDEEEEDNAGDHAVGLSARGNLAGDAEMRVTADNGANLLVLLGQEPTLRWRAFTTRLIDLCEELGVTRIVLVGALLADVPHSRPIGVFVTSEAPLFRDELGIGRSEYQGPTGVLAAISGFAAERDIPSLSIWASVPHYASQPPSPKAELAIVDKLEELLDVTIPRAKLIERAEHWEEEVDSATGEDSEIAEYIEYLERAHDMVEAPEASGEAIAKEFERFLRQGDTRGENGRGGHAAAGWTGPVPKPGPARSAGGPEPTPGPSAEDGDQPSTDDDGSTPRSEDDEA